MHTSLVASRSASLFSLLLVASLSSGCATLTRWMKADPADDAGFIEEPERMSEQRERFPFHSVWVSPDFERSRYEALRVAPVDTAHMLATSEWARLHPRTSHIREDVEKLGGYTRDKVQESVREDPHHRFRLVEKAGADTLTLELALVEVIPTKAGLTALGQGVSAVGVPGVSTLAGAASKGSVAIEGRLRDGATGDVLLTFADHESGKSAPIDLDGFTWYGHAHEAIDDWADQLLELANTPPEEKVEDSAPFKLRPW